MDENTRRRSEDEPEYSMREGESVIEDEEGNRYVRRQEDPYRLLPIPPLPVESRTQHGRDPSLSPTSRYVTREEF